MCSMTHTHAHTHTHDCAIGSWFLSTNQPKSERHQLIPRTRRPPPPPPHHLPPDLHHAPRQHWLRLRLQHSDAPGPTGPTRLTMRWTAPTSRAGGRGDGDVQGRAEPDEEAPGGGGAGRRQGAAAAHRLVHDMAVLSPGINSGRRPPRPHAAGARWVCMPEASPPQEKPSSPVAW